MEKRLYGVLFHQMMYFSYAMVEMPPLLRKESTLLREVSGNNTRALQPTRTDTSLPLHQQ